MTSALTVSDPFRFPFRFPVVTPALERVLGLSRLNAAYQAIRASSATLDDSLETFLEQTLAELGVTHEIARGSLESIPARGPLVVVANHPYGAVEGLILALLLRRVRPDVRILATEMLSRVTELRELFLFVDVFGGTSAVRRNVGAMRAAMRWCQGGGALIVFPAGEVSHLHLRRGRVRVEDPPWNPKVARLIRRSGACVTPIRFDGANGPLFQMAGLVHPRLRTAMLGRELLNRRRHPVGLRIGTTIPSARISELPDETMVRYLRLRTYLLGSGRRALPMTRPAAGTYEPLVTADPTAVLQQEMDAIPATQTLVQRKRFRLVMMWARQAPRLLREIGRQREIAFRAVGEGTGRSADLDRFDQEYVHLVLWDARDRKVAGAYRLGLADCLLRRSGPDALYTSTLFDIDAAFFRRTGAALEVGRSFVSVEYQVQSSALFLLWSGIAAFVHRFKHYRFLFGPVSISSRYTRVSQSLMLAWLKHNAWSDAFAAHVTPRNPPPQDRGIPRAAGLLQDVRDLSDAVGDLDIEHRGVPILIREYLRLGGRYAGFNVDPDFSDVIDGLMVIDLLHTDTRTLARYMGRAQTREFQSYHRCLEEGRPPLPAQDLPPLLLPGGRQSRR